MILIKIKFCYQLNGISDEKKMIIFIGIFERILNEKMSFARTRLQPLLPHQTFMQPNKFKKTCEEFNIFYSVKSEWSKNSVCRVPLFSVIYLTYTQRVIF